MAIGETMIIVTGVASSDPGQIGFSSEKQSEIEQILGIDFVGE